MLFACFTPFFKVCNISYVSGRGGDLFEFIHDLPSLPPPPPYPKKKKDKSNNNKKEQKCNSSTEIPLLSLPLVSLIEYT